MGGGHPPDAELRRRLHRRSLGGQLLGRPAELPLARGRRVCLRRVPGRAPYSPRRPTSAPRRSRGWWERRCGASTRIASARASRGWECPASASAAGSSPGISRCRSIAGWPWDCWPSAGPSAQDRCGGIWPTARFWSAARWPLRCSRRPPRWCPSCCGSRILLEARVASVANAIGWGIGPRGWPMLLAPDFWGRGAAYGGSLNYWEQTTYVGLLPLRPGGRRRAAGLADPRVCVLCFSWARPAR